MKNAYNDYYKNFILNEEIIKSKVDTKQDNSLLEKKEVNQEEKPKQLKNVIKIVVA